MDYRFKYLFLPIIIGGLLLYLIGKFKETGKKIFFNGGCLLVFILMGSNEIIALILQSLLILFYINEKSKESKFLVFFAAIFLLISLLAPGNFKRMVDSEDVFYIKWVKRIGIFGANSIYIFIKATILIPLFIKVFEQDLRIITRKIKMKRAFFICLISFIPLILLGYIMNTIGRQFENIILFYFLTSSVLLFLMFEKIKKYWWITVVIIFLPTVNLFPEKYSNFNIDYNVNSFIREICDTDLLGYNREVNERIEVIAKSDKDSIIVPKIKNVPKVLYFDEMASIKEDNSYVDDQLQKYFDKKYIRIKD